MATFPGILDTTRGPFGGWGRLPLWHGFNPADIPEAPPPPPPGAPGADGAVDGAPRVAIHLFVSPDSPSCAAALRNIERALVGVERNEVQLKVFDVAEHPGPAADAHVCFTPTLVIRALDQPPIWIFGALTDTEVLNEHLEVAGVQRATPRGD